MRHAIQDRGALAVVAVVLGVALLGPAGIEIPAQEADPGDPPTPPDPVEVEQAVEEAVAEAVGRAPKVARSTRIQGRAITGRKTPVPGATVRVFSEDNHGVVYLTSTDENGRFRVWGVPDGSYHVTIDRSGFETIVKERVEVRGPIRAVLEVRLEPSIAPKTVAELMGFEFDPASLVSVTGSVVDVDGFPVPDVRFVFRRHDGSADPWYLKSSTDGAFRFDDVGSGLWDMEIKGVGYISIRTTVLLDRGGEAQVQLVPQPTDYLASPLDLVPEEIPIAPGAYAGTDGRFERKVSEAYEGG